MTIYYDEGGTLISQTELQDRGAMSLRAGRPVTPFRIDTLRPDRGAAAAIEEREFVEIGFGKPLTIWITSAYTGDLPPGGFLGWKRGGLISSAVKSWSYNDAKPRAINILKKEAVKRTTLSGPDATEQGTSVAFYSPALVDRSLLATFEMAFDTVDEALWNSVSKVLTGAGAIPAFAAATPYLLAAGSLINMGAQIANGIFNSAAEFQVTEMLNIALPGSPAVAGYRLLTRNALEARTLADYQIKGGFLCKRTDGSDYAGATPYVIVAFDGQADNKLEGFAPSAASAGLLQQYHNVRENGQTPADALIQGIKLLNDFHFRQEADDLTDRLKDTHLSAAEKETLEARHAAVVKNILSKDFKPSAG